MSQILLKGLSLDASDLDFSEPLTVALTLHVVLAAAELDDGHFVVTTLGNHLSNDLGAVNNRSADFYVVAIADQQNAIERDGFASGDFQLLDLEEFTLGDFVLLATGNDYSVHGNISVNPAHPALYKRKKWLAWLLGVEVSPKQLRKAGKCPVKFRVRDCTQATQAAQAPRCLALTVPYPPHSMPRIPEE
jgi:hypothetical protein